MYKIKIELTKEEIRLTSLLIFLMRDDLIETGASEEEKKEYKETAKALYAKLLDATPYFPSVKKQTATIKATKVRSDRAKEKINNAINLLQFENKPITHYSISQASGVSYNTVKKHIPDLDIIGKL